MPSRCVNTPESIAQGYINTFSVYTPGAHRIGDLYYSNQLMSLAQAVQPHALSSTMLSCLRVVMNASNKRSRKAKHSGKENFDVATDQDDMDDFLLPKKPRFLISSTGLGLLGF